MAVYKHTFGDHPWAATIMSLIANSRKALAGEKIGSAEEMSREALNLRKRLLDVDWNIARSHLLLSDALWLQNNFESVLEELDKLSKLKKTF